MTAGDGVGVAVGATAGDGVSVAVGMTVGDGVSVAVGTAVGDGVSVAVGMAVGEGVAVGTETTAGGRRGTRACPVVFPAAADAGGFAERQVELMEITSNSAQSLRNTPGQLVPLEV